MLFRLVASSLALAVFALTAGAAEEYRAWETPRSAAFYKTHAAHFLGREVTVGILALDSAIPKNMPVPRGYACYLARTCGPDREVDGALFILYPVPLGEDAPVFFAPPERLRGTLVQWGSVYALVVRDPAAPSSAPPVSARDA